MIAPTTVEQDVIVNNMFEPYVRAGLRRGYAEEDVRAALAFARRDLEYAVLEADVDGERFEFPSWRRVCGALYPTDRARGGEAWGPGVSFEEISEKSLLMYAKGLLFMTGCVGGKGGIQIPERLDAHLRDLLRQSPKEWLQVRLYLSSVLYPQHVEAHHIHSQTNVAATDGGTYSFDINHNIEGRRQLNANIRSGVAGGVLDPIPEACAAGADESHGGLPHFHAAKTGLGSWLTTQLYLDLVPELAARRAAGRSLRYKTMGDGKAMGPLNNAAAPVALLERHVALATKDGKPMTSDNLAQARQLIQYSNTNSTEHDKLDIPSGSNLAQISPEQWWIDAKSDVAVFGAIESIVGPTEVDMLMASGVKAGIGVANRIQKAGGREQAQARRLEIFPGETLNSGGTVASQLCWERLMCLHGLTGWTEGVDYNSLRGLEDEWHRRTLNPVRSIVHAVQQARRQDETLTVWDVVDELVADAAMARWIQAKDGGVLLAA